MSKKWAVGVDLGGTKIEFGQVDGSGQLTNKRVVATEAKQGTEAVQKKIIEEIKRLQEKVGTAPEACGVGIAGQIEKGSGQVFFAPNLDWHNIPLKQNLERALGIPTVVVNDVRAGTYGEWRHGAGQGVKDLICLFIGTGIGGGIISSGNVLEGNSNCAGEVGHMVVDLFGPPCTCGNYGCMEAFGGGWALARNAKEAIASDPRDDLPMLKKVNHELERLSAKEVVEAANEGDPLAQEVRGRAFQAYTAGCVSLVNAFNPQRLIIGGGLGEALPELIEILSEGIERRALKAATGGFEVVRAQLKNDANVVGAGSLALAHILQVNE